MLRNDTNKFRWGETDGMCRNRLRNIEATEKAKREMMEARRAAAGGESRPRRPNGQPDDYATARCEWCPSLSYSSVASTTWKGPELRLTYGVVAQQRLKIASDGYAAEESRREAAGLLPEGYNKPKLAQHEPRHESATDEQVYDRFKKRSVMCRLSIRRQGRKN